MPVRQGIRRSKDCYVRYPKQTYATIPDGLIKICAAKKIGRNGWIVLTTLCKAVYSDGRFARIGSAEQMKLTGLNANQVGRGMKELRDAGIIEAVERTTANGYRHKDRSNFGHIAQYRFTKHAWDLIQKEVTES